MIITELLQDLSTARTEQQNFTFSVYKKFVVPPTIAQNDLRRKNHSVALQGSRGCGKTTFIRYFSHWTQFDKSRETLDKDCFQSIVLYWKPDTVFYRSMNKGWLNDSESYSFFMTISGLELFQELLHSLDNISHHSKPLDSEIKNSSQFWEAIEFITGVSDRSFEAQISWVKKQLFKARVAIKRADVSSLADIEPGAMFDLLIPIIQSQFTLLKEVRFCLYVDEFENLDEFQQRIINGYRKASNANFTWNVAHKQFAKLTSSTDGEEQLNNPDDYREMSMEEIYGGEKSPESAHGIYNTTRTSKVFTSEIFLLSLLNDKLSTNISNLSPEILCDPSKVELRSTQQYCDDVLQVMENIFPTLDTPTLAREAMAKDSVRKIVRDRLKGLKGIDENLVEKFINEQPSDALVSWSISQQKTFKSSQLLGFIQNDATEKNRFTQRINTYRLSALLSLNARYHYINIPIYSGFERFCQLSQNNIRHFIELCYQSFHQLDKSLEVTNLENFPSVSPDAMHRGATQASSALVEHVVNFEPYGQSLSRMVNRLGRVFKTYQSSTVQSEPERVSFVIRGNFGDLGDDLQSLIYSAKCWRVLIEDVNTRDKKSNSSTSSTQYRLNPIYSPHFGISYRTGRTVELSIDIFNTIINESKQFEAWLKRIETREEEGDQGEIFE